MANAYSKAGVDVTAGYEAVERIKKHVARTERLGVMGALGGFGGNFDLSELGYQKPVLVSGTDGVGTKLLLAIAQNRLDIIGIDCVAMCVNDVVAQGAQPLFFLDYVAVGKNHPERIEQIVAGVAEGCVQAGAALIGGETAEMPDMYAPDEFDLAGFTVGAVEKHEVIDGSRISNGDVLIGLASSGIHSNGYSLVRRLVPLETLGEPIAEYPGQTIGEVLLTPTKIYVKSVLSLVSQQLVHGVAHITGGGFVENIPRMLPEGYTAVVRVGSWPVLPIFNVLAQRGAIPEAELYEIFNMGIGMVLCVAKEQQETALRILAEQGESAFVIGHIEARSTPSGLELRGLA